MTIREIQETIIEEFATFEDWMDKYAYLIELGADLEGIPESERKEQDLIKGCQSRVWLHADFQNGLVELKADSDAVIVKGIVALLLRTFSNQSPHDILKADTDFINEIGLKEHLSPTRSNGLFSMIKQIKMYALAYSMKKE